MSHRHSPNLDLYLISEDVEDILLYELGEDHEYGEVIEDSRTVSIHFFVSFYTLCNAWLNEYVRIAQQQESEAAAI